MVPHCCDSPVLLDWIPETRAGINPIAIKFFDKLELIVTTSESQSIA